jgi:hypothetical protein
MTKQDIVSRLMAIPHEIAAAEELVLLKNEALLQAKAVLQHKEDGLIFGVFEDHGMSIDGKNAETRNAQLRKYTIEERSAVEEADTEFTRAKLRLSKLHNEFKALQAVAELLAREVA